MLRRGPSPAAARLAGDVTMTAGPLELAPGDSHASAFGFNPTNVCRFTVPSKKKVIAHACISDFGTATCDVQADAR